MRLAISTCPTHQHKSSSSQGSESKGFMPKRTTKQPHMYSFSVQFEGKKYEASYSIQSGVVTVTSDYGSQSTHAGGKADLTARMLLREILEGAKARGKL